MRSLNVELPGCEAGYTSVRLTAGRGQRLIPFVNFSLGSRLSNQLKDREALRPNPFPSDRLVKMAD